MPLPIFKVVFAGFRILARPINQTIIKAIRLRGDAAITRRAFVKVGQIAHQFEVRINQRIVKDDSVTSALDQDDKKRHYIKPLSEEAAF